MAIIERFFKLPESKNFTFYCGYTGCGEVGVEISTRLRKHERLIERSNLTGEILNAEYHYLPVCSKCGGDLSLNDGVDFDANFEFIEETEK